MVAAQWIFISLIIIVALAIFPPLRSAMAVMPYVYPNARIKAKEGRLVKSDRFDEMIAVESVLEIASLLENTDYVPYLQGTPLEKPGAIENVLDNYLADLYDDITKMSPKKVKTLFKSLSKKWAGKNIKIALRNAFSVERGHGKSPEDIFSSFSTSDIPEDKLKALSECKSVKDLIDGLEDTRYSLSKYYSIYENTGRLSLLESAIDKMMYEEILENLPEEPMVKRYFSALIDAGNVKLLLRTKRDGLPLKEVENFLIEGGEVSDSLKRDFDEVDTKDLIEELGGTTYHPLKDLLSEYEKTNSLSLFERELDRIVAKAGRDISAPMFGLSPLIGFLSVKEMEAKNLRTIFGGKVVGMNSEDVRSLLIY